MLPKANRLPASQITDFLKTGKRILGKTLLLVYSKKNESKNPRLAFIVSTRIDKLSVVRNRYKRLLREALYHLLKQISPGFDGIVLVQQRTHRVKIQDFEKELLLLLQKANAIKDE